MQTLTTLVGAFGLATAAGLNAYIPLLLIGLGARFLPHGWVILNPTFQFLQSDWFLILVTILLLVETLADKIPLVDHVNDLIQTLIRPAAGAVLFAAATGPITHMDPRLAWGLGFLAAGAVHGAKVMFRPLVTVTTGGVGNAVISFIEDVISFLTALLALLVPLGVLVMVIVVPILAFRWLARRRRLAAGGRTTSQTAG